MEDRYAFDIFWVEFLESLPWPFTSTHELSFTMLFSAPTLATLSGFCSLLPFTAGWLNGLSSPDILKVLGPQLSTGAQIYLPGSNQFTKATTRWSAFKAPSFAAVVEVANQNDVQETVLHVQAVRCIAALILLG